MELKVLRKWNTNYPQCESSNGNFPFTDDKSEILCQGFSTCTLNNQIKDLQ